MTPIFFTSLSNVKPFYMMSTIVDWVKSTKKDKYHAKFNQQQTIKSKLLLSGDFLRPDDDLAKLESALSDPEGAAK